MKTIRPARPEDAPSIAAIWNPLIRDTTITFTSQEKSQEWLEELIEETELFLVLENNTETVGFANCSPFRSGPGYRFTAEHSIFLAPSIQGQGHAASLLSALEAAARNKHIRILVAGISGENERAVRFHTKMGYTETARMPEVGFKFNRWLDLVLMQKRL